MEKMPSHKFKELDDMCGFIEGQYIEIMTAIEERLKILRNAERRARERECANILNTNESANTSANVFNQNTEKYDENQCEIMVQIQNENANQNSNHENIHDDGISSATPTKKEKHAREEVNKKRVKKVSTPKIKEKRAKKEKNKSESDEFTDEVTVQSAVVPVIFENNSLEQQQPDLRDRLNRFKADAQNFIHDAEIFREEILQVEYENTIDNNGTNMHEIDYRANERANSVKPPLECYYCQGNHALSKCDRFLRLPIKSRWNAVAELNLCQNCFIPKHLVASPHHCKYGNCLQCHRFHNSTLCNAQMARSRFTPTKRYTGYYARY